ncbi:hypothetical protein XAP412_730113 [Xanthomonas phaseoli pv. phaseoli]|uniref:Uncharacterized protein n=1 Tax=Xanthomonas campestris pv. phaseoli TaxID=317013 RepID=A0AB38E691_XANCH|nr:hypothetical protein XAP6984_770111 [Xanthomonas phaseoli pv. phaseoli]SON89585.1 hypothetical protein XAP412_730113 [Xanthomonas phaseoli pv. phaseoli]SON92291.1 hypothetical protein XAP7430_730113 [Xanthomonas phaseoli pv. phaseoli]SOO29155.1 hypothetical protein XAP6164_3090003 [Xanthomonas phaseoli pv. phaseoli]
MVGSAAQVRDGIDGPMERRAPRPPCEPDAGLAFDQPPWRTTAWQTRDAHGDGCRLRCSGRRGVIGERVHAFAALATPHHTLQAASNRSAAHNACMLHA